MMKASFAAIALAALLASGAAAQEYERTAEERLTEMKARHGEMLMWHLALPATAKRTPEYRALRDEWVALRDQLRNLEQDIERQRRGQWTPPE
jgi:hypothetical protein